MAKGRKQTSTQKSPQHLRLTYLKQHRFKKKPDRRPSLGGSEKRSELLHTKITGHYKVVANTKRQKIVRWLDRINQPEKDNGHMQSHIPGNLEHVLCSTYIQPCSNYLI